MNFEAVEGNADVSPRLAGPTLDEVCARVAEYYAAKLARHGATARGVDWSCTATQWLRFVQLLRICPFERPFSLIDLGCGYGALAEFLVERHPKARIQYLGIDLSRTMVRRARRRHRGKPSIRFAVGRNSPEPADYAVASGIMNVMLGFSLSLWESFVRAILLDLHCMGRRGFAVNFLTASSPDANPGQLYCPDPAVWARFCENELGRSVELLGNYGLREFTLLARSRGST
jgi:SAM-dependent methyltransferase